MRVRWRVVVRGTLTGSALLALGIAGWRTAAPAIETLRWRADLGDTWGDPRSGGRRHEGIDIFAARRTPIRSTTRGLVIGRGENALGGRTITSARIRFAAATVGSTEPDPPRRNPDMHRTARALPVLALAALSLVLTARGAPAQTELFVGLESEDAVAVVDPATGQVLRKIPVGISGEDIEGVHALATAPDGRFYYLAIAHGWPYGSVWKMSTEKDSLVARTNVGLFPATMALTPDGTWLFVANYNLHGDPALDSVSAVHTPTMTEVAQIPVCTKPHGMVASHDGQWIYASCTRDNVVRKISVASLSVVDSTNMLTDQDRAENKVCYPAGLALSADDSKLFVACHRHAEVRVLSTTALGTITATIPTGDGPYLIRMDPRGERLWVPNRNDQTYTVIDVATERAIATRPASASHPHTFAFGPDGVVYLSMESHAVVPGAIDVIDPRTFETLRSIPVGLQATGVGAIPLAPRH